MRVGRSLPEYSPIRRRRGDQPSPVLQPLVPEETLVEDPTTPDSARRRIARRRSERKRKRVLRRVVLVALLLVLLVGGVPYLTTFVAPGEALPQVTIQGMPARGATAASLTDILEQRYADFLAQPVTLTYGNQTWNPSLDDLGVELDLAATAHKAIAIGRSGHPFTRWHELWQVWRSGVDVAPTLVVDETRLQAYLLERAAEVEQSPRLPGLTIAAGDVVPYAGAPGVAVQVDATAQSVADALVTLEPQPIALQTTTITPPVPDHATVAAADYARTLLASPLELRYNDSVWAWSPADLSTLLVSTPTADDTLTVTVDRARLQQAIADIAAGNDVAAQEPRLQLTDGTLQVTRAGNAGWQLDQPAAFAALEDAVLLGGEAPRSVVLPVVPVQPLVTAEQLPTLGVNVPVGTATSSYAGADYARLTNATAAAQQLDGTLIAPDSEFSLLAALGTPAISNGFVLDPAAPPNPDDWVAGVDHAATATFRAALLAGLPITERHGHRTITGWYETAAPGASSDRAGLDAAVFPGERDLRFVNDTGDWLLLQATTDDLSGTLQVQLLGATPPARTVVLEGPVVTAETSPPSDAYYIDEATLPTGTLTPVSEAQGGQELTVYRIITADGVEVAREPFVTTIDPQPATFLRGTAGQ